MVVRLWQELKWRPSCCVIFCKVPLVFLCVWWCKQTLCFLRLSGCYGRRQHGLWEMYPTKYGSGAGWWLVQPFFEKSQKNYMIWTPLNMDCLHKYVCDCAQEVLYDLTLTSLTGKHLGRQIDVRSWKRTFCCWNCFVKAMTHFGSQTECEIAICKIRQTQIFCTFWPQCQAKLWWNLNQFSLQMIYHWHVFVKQQLNVTF